MVIPRSKRQAVQQVVTERGLSERHACQLMGLQRSSTRYGSHARTDEAATVALIREYAHEQPMYRYRIIADGSIGFGDEKGLNDTMATQWKSAEANQPNEVWSYVCDS